VVTGRARLSSTVDLHISEFMDSRSGLTYSKSMIISFGSHLEILSWCSLISDPCLSSSKTFCIGSLRLQSQELKMGFPHRLFLPAIAEYVEDTWETLKFVAFGCGNSGESVLERRRRNSRPR
jgi:hypothetical protein